MTTPDPSEMSDSMQQTADDSIDNSDSSEYLQEFIDHLNPAEIVQLKQLLSNQGDNTNEDQPPSFEDFKKASGTQ
jgi:predicted transcriptional regulator